MKFNVDKIVNRILKEAFTTGPYNTTPNNNDITAKGGTARQMLSAEWFGSPTWPFYQATSMEHQKAVALQQSQSVEGQGEFVPLSTSLSELFIDSPSGMFSDPSSPDYLINMMEEIGYKEQARQLLSIVENPTLDNIDKLINMTEALEADKAPDYVVDYLVSIANTLIEEEAPTTDMANEEEPEDSEEDTEK